MKYLGNIIQAGEGLCVDPKRVEAMRAWEVPKTVKEVRSFLGFANFYRALTPHFANLSALLIRLTGNDAILNGRNLPKCILETEGTLYYCVYNGSLRRRTPNSGRD